MLGMKQLVVVQLAHYFGGMPSAAREQSQSWQQMQLGHGPPLASKQVAARICDH